MPELTESEVNDYLSQLSTEQLLKLSAVQEKIGSARDFRFNAVPERAAKSSDTYLWDVHVIWRGEGQWAVDHNGYQYTKDLVAGRESRPSSRTQRFIDSHRFPLEQALQLANKLSKKVTVMGRTAHDYGFWFDAKKLFELHEKANPDFPRSESRAWVQAKYQELKEESKQTS